MLPKIERFLHKHNIDPQDIKYIIREDGDTVVYTIDNRTVATYLPIKDFRDSLPVEHFLHPNKGIIAAASQVIDVVDGHYEMADGRRFKYRVHNSARHDSRLLSLGRQFEHTVAAVETEDEDDSFVKQFSVLDKMPIPIYVVELQMPEHSFTAEFVFRYCNNAMCQLEGMSREQILGQKFQTVLKHADPKRLVVYMDVALNDTSRVLHEFDSHKNGIVEVTCYQPIPGHCLCMLTNFTPAEGSVHSEST